MKARPVYFWLVAFGAFCLAALAGTENFDTVSPPALPEFWVCGVTGPGKCDCQTAADPKAPSPPNVLRQTGNAAICWSVNTNASFRNGVVEVRFKSTSGWKDKTAGLIWRFQNASNYYAARADALDDSITLYKIVNGELKEYGSERLGVPANRWHTLRVEFIGPHFTVAYDNAFALAWDDDTFTNAGPVGVWTKADSVTSFDEFHWTAGPDKLKD